MIQILKFIFLTSICYGFVVQEVPKRPVLSGQTLVDHVNAVQDSWKAEYSLVPRKTMDVRFIEVPGSEKSEKPDNLKFETLIQLPTSFDSRVRWPNCNSIKLIRDQTYCGSCWAFAAAEIISDRICIQSNGTQQPIISPEDILSCCGTSCNNGCQGGYPIEAMKYWMNSGVVTGGDYQGAGCIPYSFRPCSTCQEAKDAPSCKTTCQTSYKDNTYKSDKHYAKSAYRLPTTTSSNAILANAVQMIQTEIYNNGPVEVSYQVYEDFYHYKSGVYYHVYGDKPSGHAVKIIGWGTENKMDYWLAANSWATTFGEKGFFKIRRGTNECGIESNVVAGLPKSSGSGIGGFIAFLVLVFYMF
ncbi:hypothetical protein B9Z55_026784 [Caenorhabditis nigoni]|uniref:Peptidase C1A papain C-terminal domain-containing protein n=1 Tax=Caenorhabditis nigoni TaxID=1611254 RepID=A0A2G5SHF9_9PELO|nr:hypothetical protein B9Z55_026784 [Caenorhabditis nigoni]